MNDLHLGQAMWKRGRHLVKSSRALLDATADEGSDFGDHDNEESEEGSNEDRDTHVLSAVFHAFTNLRNNGTTWNCRTTVASSSSFSSSFAPRAENAAVSRLKFQGGIRALLGIDLSWHQFGTYTKRLVVISRRDTRTARRLDKAYR